jgi:hypothetical protein
MLHNAYKTTSMSEGNNTLTPFHISAMQITPQDILKCHLTVTNKNETSKYKNRWAGEGAVSCNAVHRYQWQKHEYVNTRQFLQPCDQRS